jgi:agmatine/peptidylarginine deiminase
VTESESVAQRLTAAGVEPANVLFLEYRHEAFWTRDYGPWSVVDRDGIVHFVDPSYYPTRFRDDAVPTLLAEYLGLSVYRPDLDAEGGNIMGNGGGLCVTTSRLTYNNPPHFSFELADMTEEWLGCLRTVFLEPLDDERTGHVDLLAKFLSPDLVVVSEYNTVTDPENCGIMNENAERLAALKLADGRPVQVVRIPAPPVTGPIYRTYTNALLTDKALFVPVYDGYEELNEYALSVYRSFLPEEVAVIPVNASSVVEWGGAVHCTAMQMHPGVVVALREPGDAPEPWSPPPDAVGEVAEIRIEPGTAVTRDMLGQVPVPGPLGSLEVHLDLEGRTPNQVVVTLSNGGVSTVLHDGRQLSVLEPMPKDFGTDAFIGIVDTGIWTLTIEVEAHRSAAGLHRWYIHPS